MLIDVLVRNFNFLLVHLVFGADDDVVAGIQLPQRWCWCSCCYVVAVLAMLLLLHNSYSVMVQSIYSWIIFLIFQLLVWCCWCWGCGVYFGAVVASVAATAWYSFGIIGQVICSMPVNLTQVFMWYCLKSCLDAMCDIYSSYHIFWPCLHLPWSSNFQLLSNMFV